jgi:hypothetical protein
VKSDRTPIAVAIASLLVLAPVNQKISALEIPHESASSGFGITDMGNFPKIVEARRHWFTPPYPADTTLEVRALALPELMVEIDVIATV